METIVVLDCRDNVGNAVSDIEAQSLIVYQTDAGRQQLRVNQGIPFGFKVAIKAISCGERVIKYGAPIGQATEDIRAGDLVHIHNLEGQRGRGDWSCHENFSATSGRMAVPASETMS